MNDIMVQSSNPDWKIYKLGQVFKESNQKGSDKVYPPLSVTMKGIVPQLENAAKSDDSDNRKIVKKGDYVINSRSDRKGSGGISTFDGSVSLISIVLTPTGIHPHFAHHLLRSKAFQEEFYRWGHGIVADLWTTRYFDMKNIRLALPDLPTQRAIADFLDRETARIDQLIEKKEKMVEVLGEKRKNIINQATTIGFDITKKVDVGGKWLTQSAMGWTIAPLKRFVTIRSGYAFKAESFCDYGTPLVRMNNLKRGNIDLTEAVSIPDSDYNHSAELRAGDILLGMSGSIGETGSLGNFALVKSNELPLLLNQRVGRITVKQNVMNNDFLTLLIQSSHFLDPLFLLATSTAQFNVSPSQIGSILIAVPPRHNQENIVKIAKKKIESFDELNFRISKSIQNLSEYRSSLITAAVTGQIDVNNWQKSGTGDRRLDALQERLPA